VGRELAVPNPLAREIVEAVQLLGLDTVFEPGKVHPKDWSNPGRVRVLIKEGGKLRNRAVNNSMLLLCVRLSLRGEFSCQVFSVPPPVTGRPSKDS
jgi:signal recognition particle subunit SEC65